jgi:hypothetical protein
MTARPLVLDRMRVDLVDGVRRHRARRARRIALGGVVALIALVGGTVAVLATRDDDHASRGIVTNPGETTTKVPDSTIAPTTTLSVPAVTGTVAVDQFPYHVIVADGSVWVLSWTQGSVQRVDPVTLEVDTVVLDHEPPFRLGNRLAYLDGRVWVAGGAVVYSIDSQSLASRTHTIDGGAIAVGAGHGSVWAVQYAPARVVRMDPSTGAVQSSMALPQNRAVDIAVTDDAVWVLGPGAGPAYDTDASWLARIDPATNEVAGTVRIPDYAVRVVGDERGIVVGSVQKPAGGEYGTLLTVDPTTLEVVATVRTSARPEALALLGDHIWVGACSEPLTGGVCAYGRATLQPVAAVQTAAGSLAAGEGAVWGVRGVGPQTQSGGALDRIDPGPFG